MKAALADDTVRSDSHIGSAIRHFPSHVRFFTVAAAILVLDLWSKSWVFRTLGPSEGRSIFADTIELRRSLNDGAVFGSFTGQVGLFVVASLFALGFVFYLFAGSRRTQRFLHIALACILAGALGNLYDRALMIADVATYQSHAGTEATLIGKVISDPGDSVLRIGDWPEGTNAHSFEASEVRVRRQGVVRDFIKFLPRFPAWVPRLGGRDVWPWVFNVADASLVCGVGMMLVTCWPRRARRESARCSVS